LLDQAELQGTIPKALARKVRRKGAVLAGAVARVEKASGVKYPPYYVEPSLPVQESGVEYGQMGVLFARVIPTTANGGLVIVVQFTAALLAFATKGTVEAVAAHEFTHYVDMVRRFSRMDVASDERSTTLFEASGYADTEKTVEPGLVFGDRKLVALVRRKFKDRLVDEKLDREVGTKWVAKNLPMRAVPIEESRVKVPAALVATARFDPVLLQKLADMKQRMLA
jgi:hypothetical protein